MTHIAENLYTVEKSVSKRVLFLLKEEERLKKEHEKKKRFAIDEYERLMAHLAENSAKKHQSIAALEVKEAALLDSIDELKKEEAIIDGRIEKAHEDHQHTMREHHESLNGVQIKIANTEKVNLKLEDDLQTKNESVGALEAEEARLKQSLHDLDVEIRERTREVERLRIKESSLNESVRRLQRHRDVKVEEVLTERNKLLFDRYQKRTEMNKALDEIIQRKRTDMRKPLP